MKRFKLKVKCFGFSRDVIYIANEYNQIKSYLGFIVCAPDYKDIFEEVKEPLLVTEDGIEIFDENVRLYGVNEFSYEISVRAFWEELNIVTFKWFSTKEAAKKWIDENRPIYSKQQIRDAVDSISLSEFLWDSILFNKLGI